MFDNLQTWRASMQEVERDIEDEFGEPLRIIPSIKRPNYQPVAQYARAVEVRGVFSNTATLGLKPTGHAHEVGALVETRKPVAKFSLATVNGLGFPLVQGCYVDRGPSEAEVYEVRNVMPDRVSRLAVDLVQIGRPATLSGLATARADVPVVEGPDVVPPPAPPAASPRLPQRPAGARRFPAVPVLPIRPAGD